MIAYLSKIIKFDKVNIVGVFIEEETTKYYMLCAKKTHNKMDITAKRSFSSFAELNEKAEKKTPVILLIDGKGILNKEINPNNENDVSWQKNIDFNTISFTRFKTENSTFISFCRKNSTDAILASFQKSNFQVLDLYVGSFPGALLQGSIGENPITSGNTDLEFSNGTLNGFAKNSDGITKKYSIDNDMIYSRELPLYGALLHFFAKPDNIDKSQDPSLNIEEIIYKKAFNFLGTSMLIGFLTSLLASYLLIQFYSSKNADLNLKNTFSSQSYQKIVSLEKQKEEKLKIIKRLGSFSNKYLTAYAYELVKNVPGPITVDELNIFPVDKDIKTEKKVNFQSNTIKIKGETFNEKSIDDWMVILKNSNWIKTFEITSLKKDKNNKTHFEIKVTIQNV